MFSRTGNDVMGDGVNIAARPADSGRAGRDLPVADGLRRGAQSSAVLRERSRRADAEEHRARDGLPDLARGGWAGAVSVYMVPVAVAAFKLGGLDCFAAVGDCLLPRNASAVGHAASWPKWFVHRAALAIRRDSREVAGNRALRPSLSSQCRRPRRRSQVPKA